MLQAIHCYRNWRPNVDWNTCGQAAIATITDFWELDPWGLPRTVNGVDNKLHWDNGAAIDAVRNEFPPDVVAGLGTTGGTIRNALQKYGLANASVAWSGFASAGWEDRWRELRDYLDQERPVPVLVDCGALGGTWYTAHWAIATAYDSERITLGAMSGEGANPTHSDFLHAWHCSFLPSGGGLNHCAVFAHK